MTPDFSTRAQRPSVRLLDVVALVAGAALLAYAGIAAWRAARSHREAEEAIRTVRQESASTEQRLSELSSGRKHDDELFARAALTLAAPPTRVMAEIERCLPRDVRLDELTLEYDTTLRLEMHVVARRPRSYDLFLERLEASQRFGSLSFGTEARTHEMMKTVVRARFIPEDGA